MIIMTIGIPCSGKTTWCDTIDAVNINRDELRKNFGISGKFDKASEKKVFNESLRLVRDNLSRNLDVIVSDTNINVKTRMRYESIATEFNVPITYKIFTTDPDLCIKRGLERSERPIGKSVIGMMHKKMSKQFMYNNCEHECNILKPYAFECFKEQYDKYLIHKSIGMLMLDMKLLGYLVSPRTIENLALHI